MRLPSIILANVLISFVLACGGAGGGADPGGGDAAEVAPDAVDTTEAVDSVPDSAETSDPATDDGPSPPARRLTILHTNDFHGHVTGTGPEADYTPATAGDDAVKGGFARIAAMIAAIRKDAKDPVLVLDAGDFSMGTAFEALEPTAPELSLYLDAGYDFVTIGNHEFDWGPNALAAMLGAFSKQHPGAKLGIVASNFVFSATEAGDDTLEAAFKSVPVKPYKVVTLVNGLKVGVFGLFSQEAADDAPFMVPVTIEEPAKAAEKVVAAMKQEGCDLIVAISHGGVDAEAKLVYPDESLAKAVEGIDVIVSGHSHSVLMEGRKIGDTRIVHAGCYGEFLGRLDVEIGGDGGKQYTVKVTPVDDTVAGDAGVMGSIEGMVGQIDAALKPLGLSYGKVLAETAFDVQRAEFAESPIGDLVTDAMRAAVDKAMPVEPLAAAFHANGQIRADLLAGKTGKILFADVFRVVPLGFGFDGVPGYPIVRIYVTGAELKAGVEVAVSGSELAGDNYYVQVSGIKAKYEKGGLLFDRVKEVHVGDEKIDISAANTKLYPVVTDFYIGSMFKMLEKKTFGMLVITPKDKDGKPVEDLTKQIVDIDQAAAGVQELKAWAALAGLLGSFEDKDEDGIPDVPEKYETSQGRIVPL